MRISSQWVSRTSPRCCLKWRAITYCDNSWSDNHKSSAGLHLSELMIHLPPGPFFSSSQSGNMPSWRGVDHFNAVLSWCIVMVRCVLQNIMYCLSLRYSDAFLRNTALTYYSYKQPWKSCSRSLEASCLPGWRGCRGSRNLPPLGRSQICMNAQDCKPGVRAFQTSDLISWNDANKSKWPLGLRVDPWFWSIDPNNLL